MAYTSLRSGRFTAAQQDYCEGPRVFERTNPVLFLGVAPLTGFDEASHICDALIAEGFRIYQPSLVNFFGTATATSRINDTLTFAAADGCGGLPILVGQSNGATSSLYWAATHPCAAVVALIPAIDVQASYEANTSGVRAVYESAYSITYPTPIPDAGNPMTLAMAGDLDNTPVQVWYASNDAFSTLTVEAYATAVEGFLANAPLSEAHDVGALGHTEAAVQAVSAASAVAFVLAHL